MPGAPGLALGLDCTPAEQETSKRLATVFHVSLYHKPPGNPPQADGPPGLLSHPPRRTVPSTLTGLTSVFGIGTGVAPSLSPPGDFHSFSIDTVPTLNEGGPPGLPQGSGGVPKKERAIYLTCVTG